jgi:chromosomal replication initiator protein
VLLIDDIQFIAGKVGMQNEVFHTFQALFDEGKQIILASDRPPKDINPLEERLRSRFEGGLLADINLPDLELRVAIIKKKAEDFSIDVPNEVLMFLAENLRSNIRQIEGVIKKLAAMCMLNGRHITLDMSKEILIAVTRDAEPLEVTIDKIFAAVVKKYGIQKDDIIGQKRAKDIALARHTAIYLVREITELSLKRIGSIFDNRDHTSILHSYEKAKELIVKNPLFQSDVDEMKKEILGG